MFLRLRNAADTCDGLPDRDPSAQIRCYAGHPKTPGLTYLGDKNKLTGKNAPLERSDVALVRGLKDRDEGALAELYNRYADLVYSVALRVVKQPEAAEDVLQEIFLQLWQAPQRFEQSRGAMASWLTVVARNRGIDWLRRQKPQEDLESLPLTSSQNVEDEARGAQLRARLERVLDTLTADQRRAAEMVLFEGMTQSEVAEQTGAPLGTVKTRLRTALQTVRKALG